MTRSLLSLGSKFTTQFRLALGACLKKYLRTFSTGTDRISYGLVISPVFCPHARFTATAQTDLKEPLKVLGVTEMFDPSKANFAKITRTFHLKLILQVEDCVAN